VKDYLTAKNIARKRIKNYICLSFLDIVLDLNNFNVA